MSGRCYKCNSSETVAEDKNGYRFCEICASEESEFCQIIWDEEKSDNG